MATLTELVNMALLECGAQPLDTDIDDATERARAAKTAWPFVRKTILRLHPWNPPTKRALLDADATAPSWGFATRYPLPSDYIRMLDVDTDEQWRIEGAWLVTDATGDDLGVRYVYDETDPADYDATLTDAMVLFMAFRIMHRLSGDKGMRDRISADWQSYLREAKRIDGLEQTAAELEDDTFITARY